MEDSSDDEYAADMVVDDHTHSIAQPSQSGGFTQRFSAITKGLTPSAFRKSAPRERASSNEEQAGHPSALTAFRNRFQPSFRVRSSSEAIGNPNAMNNGQASPSPAQHSVHSHHSSSNKRKSISSRKNPHGRSMSAMIEAQHTHESPSPPSHSQNSSQRSLHQHHSNNTALDHVMAKNRALENEIEVYKRSIEALNEEKEEISSSYDQLKSKVVDVTTQLRIMTKRYNKMKQKNEEYKKHFQNTLTTRISAQQDTIRNYHNQLTQIKEKYDILYNEYLDKNAIIKDWESKYRQLAAEFDEYAKQNPNHNAGATVVHGSTTAKHALAQSLANEQMLAKQNEKLRKKCHARQDSLDYLAQIINQLYQNSLPIISDYFSRRSVQNQHDEDLDDEEEDDDEEDEEETEEEDESSAEQHDMVMKQIQSANMAMGNTGNYLTVRRDTPPNSSYAENEDEDEEDEEDDEEEEDAQQQQHRYSHAARFQVIDLNKAERERRSNHHHNNDDQDVDDISVEDMVETMAMHSVLYNEAEQQQQAVPQQRVHRVTINGQEAAVKQVESLLPNILHANKQRASMGRKAGKQRQAKTNKKARKTKKANKSKKNSEKLSNYRHDSHMNDSQNGNNEEDELVDSENEKTHTAEPPQQTQTTFSSYANSNHLTAPQNKLNHRSLSDISVDDDGIDKRDEDELENQLSLNPLNLPPKIKTTTSNQRSRPQYANKVNTNASSPVQTGKSSPTPPKKEKQRRRSWVLQAKNGKIQVITEGGKATVVDTDAKTNSTENSKAPSTTTTSAAGSTVMSPTATATPQKVKKSSPSTSTSASSSSSPSISSLATATPVRSGNLSSPSMDPPRSPAPPPPYPHILQTPSNQSSGNRANNSLSNNQNNNNTHNTPNTGQSQSDGDNHSNSPIISNNDQLSTPSPNPNIHGKKRLSASVLSRPEYSQRDNDDEEEEDHEPANDDEDDMDADPGNESY